MNVNVNHPSFIAFLENVTANILSTISVDNYFKLSNDKKIGTQYVVLKLMKSAVKVRGKLTDMELKSFVSVLWKKNEENEFYEFAAVLNDLSQNFEQVNEMTTAPKRKPRTIKVDKTNNG